jgi:threonine dehydrogenase-like Zn-dependent dehydrogenase
VVEEAGAAVKSVRAGDRVIVPFSVSCGHCEWCQRALPTQCATTGRAVFGGRFGHVWGGGQAERIRVPFADHLCEKVPADMSDDDALFLGDILSTGYVCAENGGIRPATPVAVFGAGPVGLLAMQVGAALRPRARVRGGPGGLPAGAGQRIRRRAGQPGRRRSGRADP